MRPGTPGYAAGLEGFFEDDGMRSDHDERTRPAAIPSSRLSWSCGMINELPAFSRTLGGLTLNNFTLRADVGFLSRRPYAELSFSAVNRSPEPAYPSVQFAVYDPSSPLPALTFSATPLFDMIAGGTAEQITVSVNMREGELGSIRRFCVRVDVG